ncbi:MAG: hypothetical protein RL294_812 [Actinomycetota bacterium]|jgi:methionine-rich copper-binding protein CopC
MSIRSVVTVIITALGLAVLSAGPAFAHAELIGSSPAADSSVAGVTEVSVTAGEELLNIGENAEGFVMTVMDAAGMGLYYGDGCVTVDVNTASMGVSLATAGEYVVAYRIVSEDGHPVEGEFTFSVTGDKNAEQDRGSAEVPSCGKSEAPATDLTPWIGLATIPVVAGAIWILIRLLGKKDSEDNLD